MSSKVERIAQEMIQRYQQAVPAATNLECEISTTIDYVQLALESRRRRTKLRVTQVEPIASEVVKQMWINIDDACLKRGRVSFDDQSQLGMFCIHLNDATFFYCTRFLALPWGDDDIKQITIAEPQVWANWLRLVHSERRRRSAIPDGISSARQTFIQVIYTKLSDVPSFPAIHPEVDSIRSDIAFFFEHLSEFVRYGQPGVRKILLVGPPGAGKTSICLQLAREFSVQMPVVFCTDIDACFSHLELAAKQRKPTLVILEDADSSLMQASSEVLNFLDGINQPHNPHGSFVLMTTNFPERIETRILKRPGRIDRIYQIGELHGIHALRCAHLYFPPNLEIDDHVLEQLVTELTGAQIKELAQSCMSYAVSNRQIIDAALIQHVKDQIADDLKRVYEYAETANSLEEPHDMGFMHPPRHRPYRRHTDG